MSSSLPEETFATTLVAWQRAHGRQTLPWQQLATVSAAERDPYRVWVAEIMLQQTQVAAVVPFYRRFLERFPDVRALADAPADDVMQRWSGLGYYSRARNLHAAARRIVDDHGGRLPDTVDALMALPGIGRSTAGAIAAFGYGRRAAILDGNVKRVFARVFLIEEPPSSSAFDRRAWPLAEALLPDRDIERYTQGLMDLGATICTPKKPSCLICPFERSCGAHREGREAVLPTRVARAPLPVRQATFVVFERDGAILLERRPPTGIWGGLWSLPQFDAGTSEALAARHGRVVATATLPGFVHGFTHFVLDATVLRAIVDETFEPAVRDDGGCRWFARDALGAVGLPAPIRTLLERA